MYETLRVTAEATINCLSKDASPSIEDVIWNLQYSVQEGNVFGALGLPQYYTFSLEEIEEATNNFYSNLIGEGSQDQIYKAWLTYGTATVVICLRLNQKHCSQTLERHLEVLTKLWLAFLNTRHLISRFRTAKQEI
ncbi:hypothetical protein AQUCO_00200560v1 [Aquilegia coerulea]|uniref:Uncharacterized protein n=1 Tax=Aquilegia coerulea TaxID=218851 RepID=A0A2G5F3V5_AQUCA|nr:hypothetical protein AQUCO_00200560v1 [Aquilegia coerulea]